jgi:hypothetical protein
MMVKEAKYKSLRHKLTNFFEKSRDQWKEKCLKAKSKGKQLSNRVRFLENSKENLKIKIESLEEELDKLCLWMMPMSLERFIKVYSNLPINLRNEIILVVDNQPLTWNVAYMELKNNTTLGKTILQKLLEPERIIDNPVHTYKIVTLNFEFSLCQVDDEWIFIAGFLEKFIEYPEIIISRIAQIINSSRVESCKMIVKVVRNEITLTEWFTFLGKHVTTIDDYICPKVFCHFE